jgi:hypothetical protein
MAETIAVMNPTSSAFVRPGTPQQPPPVFHARFSPSGWKSLPSICWSLTLPG